MANQFPVARGRQPFHNQAPHPLGKDLEKRHAALLADAKKILGLGSVIDYVAAPAIPTAAVMDGDAETYSLAGGGTFEILVNDYEGQNAYAGSPGVLVSGLNPAVSLLSSADRIKVGLAGEATQGIEIGAQSTGAAIAAQIQTLVRALTAADAENQEAYDSFTCAYSAPSFETTLARAVASGTSYSLIKLASVAGLRVGQTVYLEGSPDKTLLILDIYWDTNEIQVPTFTAGANYSVGAVVSKQDDYYTLTTGKYGADMTVLVEDGASENASVVLKLKAAGGAASTTGEDAIGVQSIPYVDADFSSPAAATAAEVAVVLNKRLTGAVASDAAGTIRLTANRLGAASRISAVAGDAVDKLGLSETAEVGTETDVVLSLDEPDIQLIITVPPGDHIVGSTLDATVQMRRKNIENISGIDQTGGGVTNWIVFSKPKVL